MRVRGAMLGMAAAIGWAGALGLAARAQAPAPAVLPPGPGLATLKRVCSGCHAPDIVAGQRLSSAAWHKVVEEMADNGAVATDAELTEISAYLSRAFPEAAEPAP